MGRSLQNRFFLPSGKTALLFEQRSFDDFALDYKGDEYGFAGTVFVRRKPRQAVAAVYQFFDGELQAKILCYRGRKSGRITASDPWQLGIGNESAYLTL